EIDDALADEIAVAVAEVDMPDEVAANEPIPVTTETPDTGTGAEPAAEPEVITLVEGTFVGRSHPAEGMAVVLTDGTDQRFLRFEDFATDNGPDLNVYLTRADADADAGDFGRSGDFVDLGDLKGNVGPQNYEIPADVDLSDYDTVVIWCVRFAVAFAAADLADLGT
ncbi:MAG: DM13 domain-containing protein, partial [Acidimicrobiales bacterium]